MKCRCLERTLSRLTGFFIVLLVAFPSLTASAEKPLRIGSDKQLFIGPLGKDGRDNPMDRSGWRSADCAKNSSR